MMSTTIKTTSELHLHKIQNYLKNKKIFFASAIDKELFSVTLFNLSSSQTNELIHKMTRHFHLTSVSQQGSMALAA